MPAELYQLLDILYLRIVSSLHIQHGALSRFLTVHLPLHPFKILCSKTLIVIALRNVSCNSAITAAVLFAVICHPLTSAAIVFSVSPSARLSACLSLCPCSRLREGTFSRGDITSTEVISHLVPPCWERCIIKGSKKTANGNWNCFWD